MFNDFYRYLEEILTENPSEHPTVVLSQINYEELKHLVDFMYAGEVAVETDKLGKLLEAARILKIKGLWEVYQQMNSPQYKRAVTMYKKRR